SHQNGEARCQRADCGHRGIGAERVMPRAGRLSELAANTATDAVAAILDGGTLELWGDTAGPLATLRLGVPAFALAKQGIATATALRSDTSAAQSGQATQFRLVSVDRELIARGSVGLVSESGLEWDLELNTVEIERGAEVSVSYFAFSVVDRRGFGA